MVIVNHGLVIGVGIGNFCVNTILLIDEYEFYPYTFNCMGKMYVVRHGETDFNVQGRYQGNLETQLNDVGKKQVGDLAKVLSKYNLDLIITSPLARTRETAQAISQFHAVEVLIEPPFMERGVGVFQGLTREEIKMKFPDLWEKNVIKLYNDAPPGGESIRQVEERVVRTLLELKLKYPDKNILIVTHLFIARVIYMHFNKLSHDTASAYLLKNAGMDTYEF